MKNPLPASLWFLRHDASTGLLQQNGFVLTKHLASKEKIYVREGFHLFCDGFWFEKSDHYLVYRNPSRSFYRLPKNKDPLSIPGEGEQRLRLEDGFKEIENFLVSHEEFVCDQKGSAYRAGLIQTMPRAEQRYAKNWKVAFAGERRSVTM